MYLTDVATLELAAAELARAFPDPWIRQFSVKANDVPAIVARVTQMGAGHELGANVVSSGEWRIARAAGVANGRITLEGIGKTNTDLKAAVGAAAGGDPLLWVAVESTEEAAALADLAGRAGLGQGAPTGNPQPTLDVLLRFNPQITPETHASLAVGSSSSKFGMTDAELSQAIDAGGGPGGPLRWRGIQVHVGSQLGAVDAWREAARRALALLALLGGRLPDFDTLDLGGGFPVAPPAEPAPSPARFARELPALLDAMPADRRPARLAVEPGRYLVARAGWLVARVLHVRERPRHRPGDAPPASSTIRTVVIDAGMTELIRPALYGAYHPIVALTSHGRAVKVAPPGRDAEAPRATHRYATTPAMVEGPICESTDHLGSHNLPPLRRGDLVAIRDAGAYAASFASRYNGRPRPPQILLESDSRLVRVRRRDSLGSLL